MVTPILPHRLMRFKRLAIWLVGFVGLIVLLTGVITFWLPGYAKTQLETRLTELLQRQVTVVSVEIKPYTLELIVSGFHIADKGDTEAKRQTFFSFEKLHLDLSIETLTRRAPVISAISLTAPKLRLTREAEGVFNFSDLLEKFNRPSEEESTQAAKFSIANVSIRQGRFEFDDRLLRSTQQLSEINLTVPMVANLDAVQTNWIEPHFEGKINGAPFAVDGKLSVFAQKQEAVLTFKIDQLDLMQFAHYIAMPQGIALLSGELASDLHVTFVQSGDDEPDIQLKGSTVLQRLAIRNSAVAVPYQADLKRLMLTLSQVHLNKNKPSRIQFGINEIDLTRIGDTEPILTLAKFSVDSVVINEAKRQLSIGDVTLDRLHTTLRRDADGIELLRLFDDSGPSPTAKLTDAPARTMQAVAKKAIPIPGRKPGSHDDVMMQADAKPDSVTLPQEPKKRVDSGAWAMKIKRINLKSAAFNYDDVALKKAMPMLVDSLDLTIDDVDFSGEKPSHLTLQARVNQKGKIKVSGSLAHEPLTVDLTMQLDSVDFVSLQGWMEDKLAALLTSGDISFDGKIKISGDPMKIVMNGSAQLANFNLLDASNSQDLLRWQKMAISHFNFVNEPLRIDINTIDLQGYFARLIILPDGSLNLKQILRQDAAKNPDNTIAESATSTVSAEKQTPVYIDKIVLQHGNIKFSDRFIKPNYRANLTGLSGQIGPLYPDRSGTVEIVGALDKTAPLQIKGEIDPFSAELSLDLTTKVKDIDLPPFSPYSAKYVGYEIEKGKLSADVYYHVEKGALTADNKIFLDQFTLGKEVESENAVSLPLSLAISLLKNRRGEIDIHLPLQGSLDDPQFNLGDILFTALVNLITKAVTSPFALIGSVLEKEEELSEITFIPGFSNIEAESAERLRKLAEILDDRPSLKLEIIGHYDPNLDRDGLKLAMLQNIVKAQKLADDARWGVAGGTMDDIALNRKDYDKYLAVAYKEETFEKPKNALGFAKSLPVDEMERLMLANIAINDSDLKAMAENRAIAARNWLIENGEVASERIFVVGVHENEASEQKNGSRVEFLLK